MGKFIDWLIGPAPTESRADEGGDGIEIPSRDAADRGVTTSDALGLIAVYRAVSIRVIALKQMSLDVEQAGKPVATPAIIRLPDPATNTALSPFIEQTVVSLNLSGNAYWRKRNDSAGALNSLEVLNPHDVTIRTASSGRVVGYTYRGHDLKVAEVQHLSKLRVPGTPYGLGPIQAARAELRGVLDLRDYAANWFESGDVPSGVLSSKLPLTAEQAKANKAAWKESRGGTRDIAVLGGDVSYSPVYLSPEDAQFIQNQQWATTSVARLFGVPTSLMLAILDGNSMSYANVSQEWLAFVRFGLADDLKEIEDAFTAVLPIGQRARFNVEALLRMDTSSRYAAHAAGISAGWLLPSEARAIENLPPITGIDERAPLAAASKKEAA